MATSDEEFEWALQMNFFSGLRATRAALETMLEQRSGSIVNVASVNAFFQPDAATVDYGVAKAAVVNLSKSLSQQFGPQGIRVNCVSPGQVGTDLWLGDEGVAATVANATGVDAETVRAGSDGDDSDRPVHHAPGGRGADHDARVRSSRQRHRRQLRDRRRPHQDDLRPIGHLRGGSWWLNSRA